MTTRLGTKYQKSAPQPSPTMESSLEALIRTMNQTTINQMNEQFIQMNERFTQMNEQFAQIKNQTQNQYTDLIAQMTQTNPRIHNKTQNPRRP